MSKGGLLAVSLGVVTIALVAIGTIWPVPAAQFYAGKQGFIRSSSTPEEAVRNVGEDIRERHLAAAYSGFANKAQFTEQQFEHDLWGSYLGLRTYSVLDHFDVRPIRASNNEAEMQLKLYWSTVVGISTDSRNLHLLRNGDRWDVEWPFVKEATVPPQVIPVNYLRWDVIYPGGGDDWGVQDVEAPHVKIVDMHPIERADGVVIMGELLNEDVVPAYVSVSATLESKNQGTIATEGAFDRISHLLLPKQVTPFFINFPKVALSDVGKIHMTPFSTLVAASADPVIEIQDEKLNPAPDASVTGELVNQSGQIVNVAHVLATFYDKTGQLVWVSDAYVDHALLPQTPAAFLVHIPEDLARKISTERTVVATFSVGSAR